ncbi:glucose-6-phosphate dehydrogenase assembly protein OpcA [Actinoallomurus iriomotensis]|uniref:Uncharacterized protein n=1 Tax=Actinoallomurus iriomotensis TaxID=478107 RepID=A0A9W6W710_9ACTN|nr:glucose-6-phosphate dehydrogenase assembly protein OpcA [Actinoallomurus iriomotensis]GLY92572.1 hypothetical protein Airi02_105000 [Actinoallomurus iriomotensis]
MIIDLVDTTTYSIEDALTAARHRMGGPAVGKVLTLVIVTTEADQYDAVRASAEASREHPSRIIAVIPRGSDEVTRMDAEIHVAEAGPGEIVLLRLYGLLVRHAESVVSPLLVPDAPVVTWWPGFAPERPGVSCELSFSRGPGITIVRLPTAFGSIAVARPDGRVATLSRPGEPDRQVALHRRHEAELIAEELRRLEPDDVYREALQRWPQSVVVRGPLSMI